MGFKKADKPTPDKPQRTFPIDQNNEQYLLGHAMSNPRLGELLNGVDAENFLFVNHCALCQSIQCIISEGLQLSVDTVDTVRQKFQYGEKLTLQYVGELCAVFKGDVTAEDYKYHLNKLQNDKIKDRLAIDLLPKLIRDMVNPRMNPEEIAGRLDACRSYIEDKQVVGDFRFATAMTVDSEHDEQLKEREAETIFKTTGYLKLDVVLTDGYAPKKITIIAGRPGMAKSAYIANSFLRLAHQGIPCAIYNFEMDRVSMYDRMVSVLSEVPLMRIVKDRKSMNDDERKREREAKEELKHLPIFFYRFSTQSIDGLRRELRQLREKHNVQIVAYDLFKKMRFRGRSNASTADVINEALDELQVIGKDLEMHQILVVQIGRSAEKRKNKRPMLSELKDAGGFEEIADTILFLYRQAYYQQAAEVDESNIESEMDVTVEEDLEVIIAKQRQGTMNKKVMLHFRPALTYIAEKENEDGIST